MIAVGFRKSSIVVIVVLMEQNSLLDFLTICMNILVFSCRIL